MVDTAGPVFRSPVGSTISGGPLSVTDHTDTSKLVVHASGDGPTAQALGVRFARACRLAHAGGPPRLVVGTRPFEWLIIAERGQAPSIRAELPDDPAASVVDLTHGRALLRVTGTPSARLLARLCNVDLSDDMTPDLAAFSGSVAGLMCDLVREDVEGDRSYLICFDRSYAGWFAGVVVDAATRLCQEEQQARRLPWRS
ncbi:MAG: hypothetical protein H0U77_00725 [Nocardioidaceae bacterium]|nr:hypothetical protein [Nocardioidaceae bacterium]